MSSSKASTAGELEVDLQVLDSIQRRVLWLATSIVHHANKVRGASAEVKVGGHQASSASSVSIMTALYFAHLRGPDRVSVKPHASPVLHAIEYLLGRLDERHLTTLREFGGLQSYPSRLKDPVAADFSTGSVGIGATAPIWSALAHRYVAGHFEVAQGGRQVSLVGDAELDEGACWEAVIDPVVSELGEVLWIVDVNRQSLDRIVPDIAADRLRRMFEAAGWHTQIAKYGRRLEELFEQAGGAALRRRIDQMTNEEYQRLLRFGAPEIRERLPGSGRGHRDIGRLLAELDDQAVVTALRDLGGHDLGLVLDALREADAVSDRPSIIFAYTIKAWGLPTLGHPANHSALLTVEEWEHTGTQARGRGQTTPGQAVRCRLPRGAASAARPRSVCSRVDPDARHRAPAEIPSGGRAAPTAGRVIDAAGLRAILRGPGAGGAGRGGARGHGQPRRRVLHEPRAVGSTTWASGTPAIGSTGSPTTPTPSSEMARIRARAAHGAGHSRGQPGRAARASSVPTWSRDGQPLLPVGTLYDPFVNRALEPWSFSMYAGGQSILVGTPSGSHPRARGRRPPVDHHAFGRPRATDDAWPGSRRSARISNGRCSML